MSGGDHLHFLVEAHVGFFEVLPKHAVDQPDRGEILHTTEARRLDVAQEARHDAKRIRAADASEHRRVAHNRQYLAGHVQDNLVGIAVRHHAAEAAAAGHAETTRVVNDDQI